MSAATTTPPDYDYVLVGGGAAGLSLAYHLALEPRLAAKRVLLIEPEPKDQNDRTWSYWTNEPELVDSIVAREWHLLAFRTPGFEQVFDLGAYRYCTVRGLDFYQLVQRALAERPAQFTVVQGRAAAVENTSRGVLVHTEAGQQYTASYAFDSRPPTVVPQPEKYRYLLQHFVGWEIETDRDIFDPDVVEFMDFRGAQHQEARFMYVLPFSARRALVEYTLFSPQVLTKADYEAALTAYMRDTLGLAPTDYHLVAEEVGAIPMTDHPLPSRLGARIINLGTRAGRAKPSTGYAFRRIQAQSARLVAALAATGQPPPDPVGDRWQFQFFDTLLLDIMQRQGEASRDIFQELFAHNPIERILRFLDEKTSWADNLRVLNSVTSGPFLRSIKHVLRGRPGQRPKV